MRRFYLAMMLCLLSLSVMAGNVKTMEQLCGYYNNHTAGYYYGSDYTWNSYDFNQAVTITAISADSVKMNGFYWIGDYPLYGKVDFEEGTITFAPQMCGSYKFSADKWVNGYFVADSTVVAHFDRNATITFNTYAYSYDFGGDYGVYAYVSSNTTTTMTKYVDMDELCGSYTSVTEGQDYFNNSWDNFSYLSSCSITKVNEDSVELHNFYWTDDYPLVGKVNYWDRTITFKTQKWGYYNFSGVEMNDNDNMQAVDSVVANILPNGQIVMNDYTASYDWGEGYGVYYYLFGTKATLTKSADLEAVCGSYKGLVSTESYFDYTSWVNECYEQDITIAPYNAADSTVVMNGFYFTADAPLIGKLDQEKRTITFEPQAWNGYTFCSSAWYDNNGGFNPTVPVVATIDENGDIHFSDFNAVYDWGASSGGIWYYLRNSSATLYKGGFPTYISEVEADAEEVFEGYTVYTLQGVCLMKNAPESAFASLPKGIYIVNGKKMMKK